MGREELQFWLAVGIGITATFAISLAFGFIADAWFVAQLFFIMFGLMATMVAVAGIAMGIHWLSGKIIDLAANWLNKKELKRGP